MTHSARIGLLMLCTGLSPLALAHNPICECEEHGSGEIVCTGGFSDGSGAPA